jgi:hypothetical protein
MTMHTSTKARLAVVATSTLIAGGLAVAASGATGAYFSDTKEGTVTGTIGSIEVDTSATGGGGIDRLDAQFTEIMPGETRTATARFTNTGSQPQDVWLVFDNAAALRAINQLGSDAHVKISSGVTLFKSADLKSRGTPLPRSLKLASSLAKGADGSVDVEFGYSASMKAQPATNVFNPYPADGTTKNGLPYQIVATQAGQQP